MLHYKDGRWHMSVEKVRYVQHGEEKEQYVGAEGHDWWVEFEQKWDHTEIIEFIPVEPTQEQLARFEKIKHMEASEEILESYVKDGVFPEGIDHPLRNLQIEKDIAGAYFEIMLLEGGM